MNQFIAVQLMGVIVRAVRPVLVLSAVFTAPCQSPTDGVAPCADPPYFTVLPVAIEDMMGLTVIGGLGAPGHTLPTAHAGIYLAREDVTVRVPGNIEVTKLRQEGQ